MAIYLAVFGTILTTVFVLTILYFSWRHEKNRTDQMQQFAEEIGMSFVPKGDEREIQRLPTFELFSQGSSRRLFNLLRGEARNVELSIFDYQYTTGSGKNSSTHKQTVLLMRSPSLMLPEFTLRPENFLHRIASLFGFRDINFEDHPDFSGKYLLRGKDEEAIRALFTSDRLLFFEGASVVCLEGKNDQLVIYRAGERPDPARIRAFLEEGFAIYAKLGD